MSERNAGGGVYPRDWNAVRESKEAYWVAAKARMTPAEALHLADELRLHVQSLRPDWPTACDREADLEAHARLAEMFSRVRRR